MMMNTEIQMNHGIVAGVFFALGCLGACSDDGGASIRILQNQVPSDGCIVPAQQSEVVQSHGVIDVRAINGYIFTPIIENRTSGQDGGQLVFMSGANVDLEFEEDFFSAAELSTHSDSIRFAQRFSGSIPGGGTAGYAFEVIPAKLLEAMVPKLAEGERTLVLVEVEAWGEIRGNTVKSNVFTYPVDVCNGCLFQEIGFCEQLAVTPSTGGSCQQLQDGIVDCCTDPDNSIVCPARLYEPPAAAR